MRLVLRPVVRVLCFRPRVGEILDGILQALPRREIPVLRVAVGAGSCVVFVAEDADRRCRIDWDGGGAAFEPDDGDGDGDCMRGTRPLQLAMPGDGVRLRILDASPHWTADGGRSYYGELLQVILKGASPPWTPLPGHPSTRGAVPTAPTAPAAPAASTSGLVRTRAAFETAGPGELRGPRMQSSSPMPKLAKHPQQPVRGATPRPLSRMAPSSAAAAPSREGGPRRT